MPARVVAPLLTHASERTVTGSALQFPLIHDVSGAIVTAARGRVAVPRHALPFDTYTKPPRSPGGSWGGPRDRRSLFLCQCTLA